MNKGYVPEKYRGTISFMEDVGENGKYVLNNGMTVELCFEYLAAGYEFRWIAENLPVTEKELDIVCEFIGDML